VAPMVAYRMSVRQFVREVMLFNPRARRCGTLQALSDSDGLTRKPISDCIVYVVTVVLNGVSGLRRRVLHCCVVAG
jgi:hypothetical protein